VCRSMSDLNPLPGTDEVSGNVTVDGQHHDADEDC
jgi:hypothetical protein